MNERERAIIEAIIDKSDKRKHNKALTLLLYGEDTGREGGPFKFKKVKEDAILSIPFMLQDLIRKKFDNIKFEDAYSVFASGFQMHLDSLSAETFSDINELKKWIHKAADNYAKNHSKEIREFEIGDEIGKPVTLDENRVACGDSIESETEVDGLNENATNSNNDSDGRDEAVGELNKTIAIPLQKIDELDGDSDSQGEMLEERDPFEETIDFAKWRFEHYLCKMTNEIYKDLLFAVFIEDVDRETLAEEYAWSNVYLNTQINRAWNTFISVALDDIQHCEPDLFRKYEYHEDMDDKTANLLREFFICKFDVQQLALLHHMNNYAMKMALAKAYKKLLKIHKNETEVIEKEIHKEEKRQKRMKRLYEMYKSTLMKEYPEAFWQLTRYFKDFNGEISVMTEWALNNNTSVDELERQIETSFDLLNAIDKERGSKKNSLNEEDNNN